MPSSFNYSPTPTAGSVTATASGKLSDGSKVILNSDGTVSVIAATGSSTAQSIFGGVIPPASPTPHNVSGERCIQASYGSVDNIFVLWYKDQNTSYLFAVTAIITGSIVTFGTPVAILSAPISAAASVGLSAAFDPINNRHYCLYIETSIGTYGGTATCTTQGQKVVAEGYNSYAWATGAGAVRGYSLIISPTLNGANQQALIVYSGYSYFAQIAIACKMTSTNITYGTAYTLYADYQEMQSTPCFISESIAAIPGRNLAGYTALSIVTLSNTTLTINNQTVLNSDTNSYAKAVAYNSATGNLFCAFQEDTSNSTKGVLIKLSGTTPTLGTVATIRNSVSSNGLNAVVANPVTGDFWYQSGNEALRIIPDGTTFTVGTQITIAFPALSSQNRGNMIYNPANYSFVVPAGQSVQMALFKGFTSTLNSNNFLGISSGNYGTGSAATIQTIGSVDDAQSGLTAGTDYYVSPSGALDSTGIGQPYAGLALSPTRLLIKG